MKFETIKKLLAILEPSFKKSAVLLQIYLIIGVLFESVGLGMLIPLVNVITDAGSSGKNVVLRFIKDHIHGISDGSLILMVLAGFVFIYFLKTVFVSFMIWKQNQFTMDLTRNVSTRLFHGYVFQPYVFFLDKNSAYLMRNVQVEVSSITAYVQGVMFIQTEVSVLIGILATLLFLEPYGAVIILAFVGITSYLLFSFSRRKISNWGKSRQAHDGLRTMTLMEGLTGVTELKLFNKEEYFVKRYSRYSALFYSIQQRVQFMMQTQRYYLELILVLSIALLSATVIFQGRDISTILPSLSLFMFAALRMLPSANRIISSLQSMRFAKSGVDMLYNELEHNKKNREKHAEIAGQDVITIGDRIVFNDICYTYPSASQPSLTGVHLEIPVGAVVGVIGQSGAGKTTLINIITGLLTPDSGNVLVDEKDISDRVYELRKFIGYVPQQIFLVDDTLQKNIAFGIDDKEVDEERMNRVIEMASLKEVVDQLPSGINTVIGERGMKLSGGQRQRIGIARALYNNPTVLILDEGTSALDSDTETAIMNAVATLKGKLTIIMVAHRYSTLNFCDIVYKLHQGKVIGKGKIEEFQ
jgi:ABC-type multidrug transport system fused ATPase/permease subunit